MHLVDHAVAGELSSDVGTDETDVANASSGLFQPAYVSAVEHPQHFWMQMLSDRSTQLDTLISEMTSFYETQVRHTGFPRLLESPGFFSA